MARRRNSRPLAPRPSVPDPRRHLLKAVLGFVRAARSTPGVLRIALLGSLATDKTVPKDADVLVTIYAAWTLAPWPASDGASRARIMLSWTSRPRV